MHEISHGLHCSSISTCCHRTRLTDIVRVLRQNRWLHRRPVLGSLSFQVNKWVVLCLGESVLVQDRFVRDCTFWDFCHIVSGGLSPMCRFRNEPKALETREEWRFTVYLNDTLGFISSCVPIWDNAMLGILWSSGPGWSCLKCPRVGYVSQRISLQVTFWACPKKICLMIFALGERTSNERPFVACSHSVPALTSKTLTNGFRLASERAGCPAIGVL